MKRIIIILSIFTFFCSVVRADVYDSPADFKTIINTVPKMESIKCKFKQEKILKNVSTPLVSGGNFEYIENKGVYFHTLYPFKSDVDYTNKSYKQINDIVKAVSSKKYTRIENEFDFYLSKKNNDWILGLKPKKNSNSYNFIQSVTIYGNDYIKQIAIIQANGNKNTIWFEK